MANSLTRQYPQNITPDGVDIEGAFHNDDNEFKNVYTLLQGLVTAWRGTQAPNPIYPCMWWIDTGNGQIKQATGDATNFVVKGTINSDGTIAWNIDSSKMPTASQIGAAPANYGLGPTATIITGTDLDSLRGNGFFMGFNLTHSPWGAGWTYVISMSNSSDQLYQQAFNCYTGNTVFTRYSTDGGTSWSAWEQLAKTDDPRFTDARPANGGTSDYARYPHRLYRGGSDDETENIYYVAPHWENGTGWRLTAYNTSSDEQGGIHKVKVDYADIAGSVNSISGAVISILAGTVAHGGTIPLPSGYTQDQCYWMVSTNSNDAIYTGGSASGVSTFQNIYCSANANRVVTCYIGCQNYGSVAGTANYIIIGVR